MYRDTIIYYIAIRWLTAFDSWFNIKTVSSQLTHASVIETPYLKSFKFSGTFCAPSFKFDSIITPHILLFPVSICKDYCEKFYINLTTDSQQISWFLCFFKLFPCEKSIMMLSFTFDVRSVCRIACTLSESKFVDLLPPRRMTWQSELPLVFVMAAKPCFVTPKKWWGWVADLIASTAISTWPSVPFWI